MPQKLGSDGAKDMRLAYLGGKSQKALARMFGVSEPMVARVLKNTSYPDETGLGERCAEAQRLRVAEWKAKKTDRSWVIPRLQAMLASGELQVDFEAPQIWSNTHWLKVYTGPSYPYPQLHLRLPDEARPVVMPVHRFIWIAAHGVPPAGLVIHHRNADRLDYRLSNLELTTNRQNLWHSTAAGTHEHAKLDEVKATEVRESFLAQPRSAGQMAAAFGISQRTARTLLLNKSHPYGTIELRERVASVYEEMTRAWRSGSRGSTAGTRRPVASPAQFAECVPG